jgi:hypothetical protein
MTSNILSAVVFMSSAVLDIVYVLLLSLQHIFEAYLATCRLCLPKGEMSASRFNLWRKIGVRTRYPSFWPWGGQLCHGGELRIPALV